MSIIEDARKLRPIIEQAMQTVDDNTALKAVELYPHWEVGITYYVGFKVQYNDKLYKVRQQHTSQADWLPDKVPSLYTEIDETDKGTLENPIPYNGNMVLEQGKYYTQNDVIYLCTRDTVNPVYNDLSTLVGIYVEIDI
jgi:hypothetical protein